ALPRSRRAANGPKAAFPLRATRPEPVHKAREIRDVERRRDGALVAVGRGIPGHETVKEAGEILDREHGGHGAAVAVGVAGAAASGESRDALRGNASGAGETAREPERGRVGAAVVEDGHGARAAWGETG